MSTRPLSGISVGQDDVEGRDAVARDEQQALVVERVELANLAARDVACGFRHGRVLLRDEACEAVEDGVDVLRRSRSRSKTSSSADASSRAVISASARDERRGSRAPRPRPHRVPLHEPVGLVALEPGLDEREQQAVREEEPVRARRGCAASAPGRRRARRRSRRTGRACSRARGTRPGSRPARPTSARCRARARAATFSSPTTAAARTTRARPQIRSATFGFRLCGIADEPFMPVANGSSTSRTSVRARWRISVANRSSDVAAERERARAARRAGRARSPASRAGPARARAARRRSARPRGRSRRTCRPCRRAGRRGIASSARARRVRSRSSSNAQPASFQPNVVGSAWMPCERPMQIVRRCSSARRDDGCERAVDAGERGARRRPGSAARARCRRRPTR